MLKPGMCSSGVYKFGQGQLSNPAKPAKKGMVNDLPLVFGEADETVDGTSDSAAGLVPLRKVFGVPEC